MSDLVTIREGFVLRSRAAASIRRMERQQGRELDCNRTTVDYGTQMDLYLDYRAGRYPYLALHPDKSVHVYKEDVDHSGVAWDTDERGTWLDDNGWIQTNAEEGWHREYFLDRDNHRNDPEPTTEQSQEDDMYAIRLAGSPDSGIIIRGSVPPYPLPAQVFETEASTYGLTIRELPDWRYATAVREQWTAFNTAKSLGARGTADLDPDDIQAIADAVRAGLPTSYKVIPT